VRSLIAFTAALLFALLFALPARAGGGPDCWRRGGPSSMAALMTQHADAIRQFREGKPVAKWAQISADLDTVAAQRDAWASGLYWYTDLEQARDEARRTGKPIVSLRLLGRLDAELSCANSRFFRTTLYPAAEVSRRMREDVVLHWSSERPVPVVTVDFGDGRKLQRTVTGNSAHYMMTADGTVVDVLPGLYGAKPFAAWLDEVGRVARQVSEMPAARRDATVRAFHAAKRSEVAARYAADARRVTTPFPAADAPLQIKGNAAVAVPALRAERLTISKRAGEGPIAAVVSVPDPQAANEMMWANLATLHHEDAALDPNAVALIRSKRPSGNVEQVLAALQRTIAQDSVRNEYTLHQTIHKWFADGAAPESFDALNERIYAQLFLTPRTDPWLGLAPANAWSALDDDGLAGTVTAAAR
jgi:hypothetical protein